MSYPTSAALVAAASGPARAALDALDEQQLDDLRTAAIVAVEGFCGQSFDTATVATVTAEGDGSDRVWLPARLARLDELVVTGSSLSADAVTISNDRDALIVTPTDVSSAYLRAMATLDEDMSPSRRRFAAGATVRITGLFGWEDEDFPDAVALAMRYDMEENALADASSLSPTIHAFRKLGLRSVRQGGLSADLLSHGGDAGLSPRSQRVVRHLVWEPVGRSV